MVKPALTTSSFVSFRLNVCFKAGRTGGTTFVILCVYVCIIIIIMYYYVCMYACLLAYICKYLWTFLLWRSNLIHKKKQLLIIIDS